MSLDTEIQKILGLSQEQLLLDERAKASLAGIKEEIRNGTDSTGNSIKDFIIIAYGLLQDKDMEIQLGQLTHNVAQHQNEQILVELRYETREGCTSFYGTGHIGIDKILQLGTLTGDLTFDLKEGNILLPTTVYAQKGHRWLKNYNSPWKKEDGPISITMTDFLDLDNELPERGPMEGFPSYYIEKSSLQIFTGNESVESYFRTPRAYRNLIKRIEKGEISREELTKRLDQVKYLDMEYADALNLLGIELPRDFKERYEETLLSSKKDIIPRLEQLSEEEIRINSNIGSIVSTIKDGFDSEDTTDEFFYGLKLAEAKKELASVQSSVQHALKKALDLGMHRENLILEWKRPGISVNVPEYITNMCQKYKVEIPQ